MNMKFLESLRSGVYFVSGIDTNVGKSYATGILARELAAAGRRVITQKLVQTGCADSSEDIELHRRIMGVAPTREDIDKTTAPEIFTYPCSPHLATAIDGREIDFDRIDAATATLEERYDIVLLEGAGGLMVPLTCDMLTIDFIGHRRYPVLLVTSGRLGSINHTLLSLEALERRGIEVTALLYNAYPSLDDKTIERDTKDYLESHTGIPVIDIPLLEEV